MMHTLSPCRIIFNKLTWCSVTVTVIDSFLSFITFCSISLVRVYIANKSRMVHNLVLFGTLNGALLVTVCEVYQILSKEINHCILKLITRYSLWIGLVNTLLKSLYYRMQKIFVGEKVWRIRGNSPNFYPPNAPAESLNFTLRLSLFCSLYKHGWNTEVFSSYE